MSINGITLRQDCRNPERVAAFRTLVYMLQNTGVNVWDARMKARKILNMPVPEGRIRSQKECCADERLLDLNFRAIVSDLRGIISGTLTPRPWADIAETWSDENQDSRNHARYALNKRDRSQDKRDADNTRYAIRKLQRILVSQGVSPLDAYFKSKQLLYGETQ